MTRRSALLSGLAALALISGGWLILRHETQASLDAGIAQFRQNLPPDSHFSYATARAGTFSRRVNFTGVTLDVSGRHLTASTLSLDHATATADHRIHIGHLTLRDADESDANGRWTLAHARLDGLVLQQPMPEQAAAGTSLDLVGIDHGEVTQLHAHLNASAADLTLATGAVDHYGLGQRSRLTAAGFMIQTRNPPARRITFDHLVMDGTDLAATRAALHGGTHAVAQDGTSDITINGFALDGDAKLLSIASLSSHTVTSAGKSRQEFNATHFTISAAFPRMSQLHNIGYDQLDLSVHLVATSDPGTKPGSAMSGQTTGTGDTPSTPAGGDNADHAGSSVAGGTDGGTDSGNAVVLADGDHSGSGASEGTLDGTPSSTDTGTGTMRINTFQLAMPGLGQLDISADFSQINLAHLNAPRPEMLQNIHLTRLDLSWRDQGFGRHILEAEAKQHGVTPQAWLDSVTAELAPAGGDPQSIGAQWARYLKDPSRGALTIGLHPPQPVPLTVAAASLSLVTNPQIAASLGFVFHVP